MTAQFSEKLTMSRKKYSLLTEPLEDYFELTESSPIFMAGCSALWRGYIGSWKIAYNKLYLVGVDAHLEDKQRACTLQDIFPEATGSVFANWYSGVLRVPQGELINYVHMGYESTYERELFITVESGVVVGRETYSNIEGEDSLSPIKLERQSVVV